MKIYNTLTKKIEEFKPISPPVVTMYSCGPTVYDYAHVGHFRTYVGTDILRRVLEYNGFQVKQVMNVTDVGHLTSDADTGEDKMEKGAKREKKSVWEIAKFYTDDFFTAMEKLNVNRANIITRATDYIPQMIELIKVLEKKDFTYQTDDGVYFDTSKFKNYGRLSGGKKGIKPGSRIEMVKGKRHPTDFALWKFSPSTRSARSGQVRKKRQMEWSSPWGTGFPGWHIECSVMSMTNLGETIDIHTGGIDHIPVHHENEITQSESATGKQFVRYWVHFNFLKVEGGKMSKSLGNIYNQHDIEKRGFSLLDCRYLYLTSHYRDILNFTFEALKAAKNARKNLESIIANLKRAKEESSLSPEKLAKIDDYHRQFNAFVNNDLNIPQALAIFWEMLKSNIPSSDKYDLALEMDKIFGLKLTDIPLAREPAIPKGIMELVNIREGLRKQQNWTKADIIRREIEEKGYLIKDTEEGVKVKEKH